MTTIYIAGPMSGLPGNNYPAFRKAASELRAAGYRVLNPAENRTPDTGTSWEDWLRVSLRQVTHADGVALLPGWENSRGADLEWDVAIRLNIIAMPVEHWLQADVAGQFARHTDQTAVFIEPELVEL